MYFIIENFKHFNLDYSNIFNVISFGFIYFISILIAFLIREKLKFYIYKNLTSDYILSEKRNYSSSYFLSIPGLLLFLLTGVGYSKTYPFNYKKLNLSKRFLILFFPSLINILSSIIFFFLSKNGGDFFKIKIINDLLLLLVYTNFILFIINIFPFPFSDTFILLNRFDTSIYAFDFIQIFFIIIFVIFKFNIKFYDLFLNLLNNFIK